MNEHELAQIVQSVVRSVDQTHSHGAVADVTLDMAKQLIAAVEQRAAQMGVNAVIAVANKGANPVAVHCMPTTQLKQLAQPGGDLYGIQHTNNGRIVIFGGGIPIMKDGVCIGGLGVSGGSEAQDTELAESAQSVIDKF